MLVFGVLAYFIGRVLLALRTREEELANMRERAAQNERLASLTTLAAGAAHELGTPLGTIAVIAKELEREANLVGPESPPTPGLSTLAEDAALIRQQVDRCRQILERMRGDVAGRSSDEPGRCSVDDVVEAVRGQLRVDAYERLAVIRPRPLPEIAAPLRAVQQAVQFLVNNAFDASPPDAPVELEVDATEERAVRITVRDRGTGMDEETLRRATEPFFTTKDPGRGMGLGLFLVRLVAERNGGRLRLDSTAGRGTTAVLELPSVRTDD